MSAGKRETFWNVSIPEPSLINDCVWSPKSLIPQKFRSILKSMMQISCSTSIGLRLRDLWGHWSTVTSPSRLGNQFEMIWAFVHYSAVSIHPKMHKQCSVGKKTSPIPLLYHHQPQCKVGWIYAFMLIRQNSDKTTKNNWTNLLLSSRVKPVWISVNCSLNCLWSSASVFDVLCVWRGHSA